MDWLTLENWIIGANLLGHWMSAFTLPVMPIIWKGVQALMEGVMSFYKMLTARNEYLRSENDLKEYKQEKNIKQNADKIKGKIYKTIKKRHKKEYPYYVEMWVTVESLKEKMGFKQDDEILLEALWMLCYEGELRQGESIGEFIHEK